MAANESFSYFSWEDGAPACTIRKLFDIHEASHGLFVNPLSIYGCLDGLFANCLAYMRSPVDLSRTILVYISTHMYYLQFFQTQFSHGLLAKCSLPKSLQELFKSSWQLWTLTRVSSKLERKKRRSAVHGIFWKDILELKLELKIEKRIIHREVIHYRRWPIQRFHNTTH